MNLTALGPYVDLAQILLYAFWIFFAGLIIYLLRENKREGYPLDSDRSERAPRVRIQGFPAIPMPKIFRPMHHGPVSVPDDGRRDSRVPNAVPVSPHVGAALTPVGNPLLAGVGPGSYALRADHPDLTFDGKPKIVPLRAAREFAVNSRDPNPIGMPVYGGDGERGGTCVDAWVDLSEPQFRYFEVETPTAAGPRRVLVPINFARIDGRAGKVHVKALFAKDFANVPGIKGDDVVTLLEEDKIMGYFGGGTLYASGKRLEPFL